ncbi:MAG: translocation/assembly module TamB, partial [Chryseobacterium gambrini]|nr:translocation/assembly module TamB [Chryseobacterium gambrini]
GKFVLNDVKVAYNNTAIAPTKQGMDFNHLNFSKLNLEVRSFKMQDNTFAGNVNSAEIQEARGLDIQKFNTDFVYNDKQAYLKDLYLQTPKTILRDEVVLNYNSIEQLSSNLGAVQISANIKDSKIGFSDILNIVPTLRNTMPFNKYPNAVLNVNANVKGSVNDLLINNLKISGIDQLRVAASGRVKNAMNPDQLYYDLKIAELSSSAKTIYNLVPKNTIPKNISLPSNFSIKGIAKGTTKVVTTDLNLYSTLGNASVKANVDMRRKNRELYDVKANLQGLQLGKIIQNKEIGAISAQIYAKGESFDFKNANADLKGHVASAVYKGYRYQNMNLTGKIRRGVYNVVLNSKDPNANLMLTASGVYNEKNPTVKVNGEVIKLDLNKLGFYKDPMILAGKIDGDFSNLDPDNLNGYLNLKDFAFSDTKEVYPIQEVNLKASSTADSTNIIFNSQIADVELKGKYKLTQIFGALSNTVNQYYQFQKPGKAQKIQAGQFFTFNAKIKNDDLIRKFVPDLKSFETINVNGNYDADSQKIKIDGQIPQVLYGENSIEDATIKVTNENNALQYNLYVAGLKSSSFALNKVGITGDVANNIINYNITTKDQKEVTQFLIAGNAKSLNDITEISLNPNGLKLNYSDWTVSEGNKIQISKNGILADNFRLSNAGSEIALQSESQTPNAPLNVSLKDFKIETITELIKKDTVLARGTINGTAQLKNITKNMTFTSDLNVSDLIVYGNPVGNLAVKVNNNAPNLLNADIALSGNNNDVKILGDYNTSSSTFDMNMAINQLQMKSVQGFSMNAINNTEGYLSGNLKITGTASKPNILGKVKFNDVGLEIAKTGSDFRKLNDEISFTNRGIEFDNFKIKDKDGNALRVDGQVLTQTYRDFAFNLDVDAQNFKVVNSEKSNDAIMYGVLSIDAGLHIRGNLDLPKVDGRLAVADNTDFTFVLPQSSPTLQERDGIVEFIDQDQVVLNKTVKADSLNAQSKIKGMDVSVNIEISKKAKMSLLIDKANGDFVKLQGEAELTGGVDPSGKTTLVGVYEVESGSYEMTVSVLKRKFDIQKGSTITWTGEPTTANLDITAVYKTEAAPIDLVEQQISGEQASTLNQFKQRIPFSTLLKMKGELLKPVITFDITTDEKNNAVSSTVTDIVDQKLAQLRTQESEMNKQVFALLLLNRFIGENPFESGAGLSGEMLARKSVSKILSQQLNNLASDLIKGVDLNFDLESSEDYSTGSKNTRTDLNVGLSKKLLNDRLKVSVGSNFALEGEARQNENMTNIAGDVTVDYSLSRDGRYMLRAYRKNEYQVALQG